MSNPLLTETPVVTINGKQQNLPRLTLSATISVISLLKGLVTPEIISAMSTQSEASDLERGISVVSTVFEELEGSEEKIYKTLGKVLAISTEEAEGLLLEEIVEIAIAFKGHPDVDFFTKRLPKMLKKQVEAPLAAAMTS